ncbi:helix-turn-helix transcriptional regulator [Staphylococcus saprophyticus]|uniref:helix-turn-helix transcriptional regulator n=1 Tax=Staphylococcus saprophyticus TaxID=29385 RepID=UPI00076B2BE2|nr:helix-turn-helix transcriptional regulator [Staphylococcus saprophyticus]AMG20033.1 XRE family transcriptional regulator [Staphylococcus saprophyticus]MBN6849415.1 helix-turn-helix transcriptional regulator [Staphylococcus saprophyticus]MDW3828414.1 helix-turn-helix transcriptional regulator [Staphylococcus saprophyticus]MDW4016111.1 helix-turn-helix transcriptional regulator [Staphylococcus saprophyticus]MDW4048360.1 helix-turn-helix transcriptional regulator [Staphylococcus saprophyticus]
MNDDTVLTLQQWRGLRGYSKVELARKSGVTERTIYSFEKDVENLNNANYRTIKKIANALDIRVENIFLDNTSEKPK